MKKSMFILLVSVLFLSACFDRNNSADVNETLNIINKTDSTFIVEYYSRAGDSLIAKYNLSSHMGLYESIDKTSFNGAEKWLTESEFNEAVACLRIFRLENNDTIFVNPAHFNKRALWRSTMNRYYDLGEYVYIQHLLEIKTEMFE